MAAPELRDLRVNTAELLRQPGSHRDVVVTVDAGALDVDDDRIGGPISVELALDTTIDGIVASGRVVVPWADGCKRCLTPLTGEAASEVDELYQLDVTDPDAFELPTDGPLDLSELVREHALLAMPDAVLCRDDCAGICPVCGADRNETDCGCDTEVRDDRWSALDALRAELDD